MGFSNCGDSQGGVRLCIDARMPNQAIRRERHPTPTVDNIIHTLSGATVFSKLDLISASEIFQNIISEQLRDIPGAFNISDDVVVFKPTTTRH